MQLDLTKFQDTLKSKPAMILQMQFNPELSQLLLMPPIGQLTEVEFSATVEQVLTMVLLSLELKMETGGSRTAGEEVGENLDSSDLQLETPVVFATWQYSHSLDLNIIIII